MKSKPKQHAKPRPPQRPRWLRNADGSDALDLPEELIMPAPIETGMIPYGPPIPSFRASSVQPSIVKRASAAARAKARALKPQVVNPLDRKHLLGVAAGAGGGLAASLAAREFGDNIGERNLAIALTALGAAGTLFLSDNWQRISAGLLAGGMSQYSDAYLTERAEKKLAKEKKAREEAERAAIAALGALPAPATATAPASGAGKSGTAPPRNAYGYPVDDTDVYGAVDRAHRAVDAMLADEQPRNYGGPYDYPIAYGDGVIDVDAIQGYAA